MVWNKLIFNQVFNADKDMYIKYILELEMKWNILQVLIILLPQYSFVYDIHWST